jgi:hypothetical protein
MTGSVFRPLKRRWGALSRGGRQLVLCAGIVLWGVVALALAISYDAGQHRRRELASTRLAGAMRDAGAIARLRSGQHLAAARPAVRQEMVRLFETTAKEIGMSSSSISLISPQPLRRIGNTDYKEATTRLFLENVRLEHLARFVLGVQESAEDIKATDIRVLGRADSEDRWRAEVVFSQLVYAPISKGSQA